MLEVEPRLIDNYVRTGEVRLIYRHLAQLGDNSFIAAEASECAADQGRFWEMRQILYDQQPALYSPDIRVVLDRMAAEVGLDGDAFTACMDDRTHEEMVRADFQAAIDEGIRARPVFAIGDQRLIGALPYARFEEALNAALNQQ